MKRINLLLLLLLSLLILSGCNLNDNESDSNIESNSVSESSDKENMKTHLKVNYHTHTYRCNHANGKDEDYVKKAIDNGYDLLGFSDHVMLPWTINTNSVRGKYSEIEEYFESILSLRDKYKDQIDILIGFECEWNSLFEEYYSFLKDSGRVDYLILGNHYTIYDKNTGTFTTSKNPTDSKAYVLEYIDNAIDALETGLFDIFAHPDYFMGTFNAWDDEIRAKCKLMCQVAKDNNVALEINQGDYILNNKATVDNSRVRYPYDKFWEVVKEVNNIVITGVDAHDPSRFDVSNGRVKAFELASSKNITITEDLFIKQATRKKEKTSNACSIEVINGNGTATLDKYEFTHIEANIPEGKKLSYWKVNGKANPSYNDSFDYVNLTNKDMTFEAVIVDFKSYDYTFLDKFIKGDNKFGSLIINSSIASSTVESGTSYSRGVGFSGNLITLKANIPFDVNNIKINAACSSSANSKMTITLNGIEICKDVTLSNSTLFYSYTCNNLKGELIITFTNSAGGYSYIKQLMVY